jgi:hypothetical protein
MPAGHVQQSVILIFLRPALLLLSSEPHARGVDSQGRFFVICDYTGKEVVGCKVQIVIVVPDQVRWLRLRAVALILWGVPVDPLVGEIRDISRNNP